MCGNDNTGLAPLNWGSKMKERIKTATFNSVHNSSVSHALSSSEEEYSAVRGLGGAGEGEHTSVSDESLTALLLLHGLLLSLLSYMLFCWTIQEIVSVLITRALR